MHVFLVSKMMNFLCTIVVKHKEFKKGMIKVSQTTPLLSWVCVSSGFSEEQACQFKEIKVKGTVPAVPWESSL